jgi:hypothetical protein
VDAGHKTRINLLAKEMDKANELRKELGKELLALHAEVHPEEKWTHPWDTNPKNAAEMQEQFLQAKKEFDLAFDPTAMRMGGGTASASDGPTEIPVPSQSEDDDLIELQMQRWALCYL